MADPGPRTPSPATRSGDLAADDCEQTTARAPTSRTRERLDRDGVGPDHAHRGQPRDLHQDRLQAEDRRRVLQHLVDLPRLQPVHEGHESSATRNAITSRICRDLRRQPRHLLGSSNQNMATTAYTPQALGEWIINLGEAAEYMFDHNIFQETLVGVDSLRADGPRDQPPGVLGTRGQPQQSPRTRADTATSSSAISCAPSTRWRASSHREALQVSRHTREMFCLMEGSATSTRPRCTRAVSAPRRPSS